MKNTIIILSILFFTYQVYPQKPSYKRISLRYIQPPSNPMPTNVKTYFVEILNEIPEIADINNFTIKKISPTKLSIAGYQRVNQTVNAHILLKMNFHSAKSESKIHKTTTKIKKEGKRIEVPAEQLIITASIKSDILMRDVLNNKDIVIQKDFVSEQIYDTGDIEDIGLAAKILKRDGKPKIIGMYRNMLDKRIIEFSDMINEKHGYLIKSNGLRITKGKGGKKYDYIDLEQAYDTLNSFNKILFFTDSESQQKINSSIDIWEKAIKEYLPNDKKARINDKIIGGLYNNIAIANFMMGNWDKIYEYTKKSSLYKESKKSSDGISNFCKRLQNLRAINPRYNKNL